MKRKISFFVITILITLPGLAWAAGFVPCGGPGEPVCQLCYWVDQINFIVKWLVGIFSVVFAIVLVISGFKLVTSAGNAGAKQQAKKTISNVFIGFVIVLGGWLLIDFAMKSLVDQNEYSLLHSGPWNSVSCADQPEPQIIRITASGANQSAFTAAEVNNNVNDIKNIPVAPGSVTQMAIDAGSNAGLSPEELKNFRGLISQESSNCAKKVGPPTAYGRAYGCTQMLVPTAREVDKAGANKFKGMSDSQVAQILQNDDAYSIELGAKYFKQRVDKYDGNIKYALASYNGGGKAVTNSTKCPGMKSYQCEKNSGYAQTRHYVSNISAMAEKL